MKITFKKLMNLLVLIITMFVLSACAGPEPTITSIQVDDTTLEENFDIDNFDLSSIGITVNFSNGNTQTVDLSSEMLSAEHLALLSTPGDHEIIITYEGKTTTVTLSLSYDELKTQLLSIYNLATTQGGFDGTYEEWLASIKGEDGLSIVSAIIDNDGHLILTLSDDSTIDAGLVVPADAKEIEIQKGETHIQWRYEGESEWKDLVSLSDLIGEAGTDGKEVTFQVAEDYIQWQYEGETTWKNLISLTTLTGAKGEQGEAGVDGKQVTFQVAEDYIQWQYEGDTTWKNLISLTTLTGAKGEQGDPGEDGKQVTFQVADGYIQWQYEGDTTWKNLIDLASLNGDIGPSAYDIYVKYHPDYIGTEEEWMDDLVNGRLGDMLDVKFDSDGGNFFNNQSVLNGKKATNPGDPIKDGFSFLGWFYNDVKWIFVGYTVTEDMTLTAKYDTIDYSITYDLDGGTFESIIVKEYYTIQSETFSIPNPTKDGHIFAGWTYEGQNIPVHGAVITQGSIGSLKLTAHWVDLSTLSFNATVTDTPMGYVTNTIYFLTMYDEGSFLLITGSIYSDGTIAFVSGCGITLFLENNIVELDFIDEGVTSLYIIINGNSMSFCNEDGTRIETEGPTQEGTYSIGDFTSEELSNGYGYYDLSFNDNAEELHTFYRDLYQDCQSFGSLTTDYQAEDGSNLFNKYDMVQYGLTLNEGFKVIKVFLLDHPEFYWISSTFYGTDPCIDVYVVAEYQSYQARQDVENGLSAVFEELDADITLDMSDLDIAYYLHNYIISRIDYAYESDGVTPQDDYWAHNIEGVVLSKGAVCEGYAEIYKLLLDHFGIYNILVTGESYGEDHEYNLVSIDGKFYVMDLTWDDLGNNKNSLTYFGMGYPRTIITHMMNTPEGIGFEYLYHLPVISEDDITLVNMTHNGDDMGLYVSIGDAFDEMTDSFGDYVLYLQKFDFHSTGFVGVVDREYIFPEGQMPKVNSIVISSDAYVNDSGFYTLTPIYFQGNAFLNSTITLVNINLCSSKSYSFFLGDNILIFNGLGGGSPSSTGVSYIASEASKISVQVEDKVMLCNLNVGSVELLSGSIHLLGPNIDINRYDFVSGTGHLSFLYSVKSVKIGTVNLFSDLTNGFFIDLFSTVNASIEINEIICSISNQYGILYLHTESLEDHPNISIFGKCDLHIGFMYIAETIHGYYDENGFYIETGREYPDFSTLGTTSLICAPNLELTFFDLHISGIGDITPLVEKDSEGYFKIARTYDVAIENNEVVTFISLGMTNDVYIPEGVTGFSSNATISAYVKNIHLPASFFSIENIYWPESLQAFIVNENNPYLSSIDGVLFTKDASELICYPQEKTDETYTVPDGVVKIDCMVNSYLRFISLPEGLIEIGPSSFRYTNIKEIIFPDSLKVISDWAFESSKLEHIFFSENSQLTLIGSLAFWDCIFLQDFYFSETVQTIGTEIFNHDISLMSITVDMDNMYFTSVDGVLYNKAMTKLIYYPSGKTEDQFVIHDSVTEIGDFAFAYSTLSTIEFSSSVRYIGTRAFDENTNITSLYLPNSITTIGSMAFVNMYSLEQVYISANIEYIGCYAFGSYDKNTIIHIIGTPNFENWDPSWNLYWDKSVITTVIDSNN